MTWLSIFSIKTFQKFIAASCCEAFQRFLGHPKVRHFLILVKFFTFSVALLTADIVTDIQSALDFYQRGHFYWGLFTLLPVFAPFFVRCTIAMMRLRRCFKLGRHLCLELYAARFSVWKNDLWQLLWHFPLIQPFRSDNLSEMLSVIKCQNWR